MDWEAWHAAVHRVAKSQTRLGDWTELNWTGVQHSRFPCPSPSPRVCSKSCPLSQWCRPTISPLSPLLLLPSVCPRIRVFSNESAFCIRWPKYWSFSFSVNPSNEFQGWSPLGLTGCKIRTNFFFLYAKTIIVTSLTYSSTLAWWFVTSLYQENMFFWV